MAVNNMVSNMQHWRAYGPRVCVVVGDYVESSDCRSHRIWCCGLIFAGASESAAGSTG